MIRYVTLLLSLLSIHAVWAAECTDVFTEAASSHSASGSIFFKNKSRIDDSSGTLDIPTITDETSGNSCSSADCVSSGSNASALTLADFEYSSSSTDVTIAENDTTGTLTQGEYQNITVNKNGAITFSDTNGTYIIDRLEIKELATANFAAGDYWVNTLVFGEEAELVISGSDTVRVYAQSIIIGNETDVNKAGTADQLVMTSYGNIELKLNSETTGLIYAQDELKISDEATVTGAVSATSIIMEADSRIFYEDAVADADFGSLCGVPDPIQLAFYEFEETIDSDNNISLDGSGQDNHAIALGDAVTSYPSTQVSCQVLDIPQNLSDTVIDAMDTGIDINDVGSAGTISFWHRSNEDWDLGTSRQLFDASNDIGGEDKYFFMSVTDSGELRFALEDSDDYDLSITSTINSFVADEWVHVAISWDLDNSEYVIYINGSVASSTIDGTLNTTSLGELNSLYIGDNRSTYFGSDSSANSANGQIDSFRLYDYVQTAAQIATDMLDTTPCSYVQHYRIEHDTQGFTCEAESVTIKACNDENCDTLYDQATSITLSPTGWVGGDTFSFVGSVDTSLSYTEAETVGLGIDAASPSASVKCFQNSSDLEISCDMEFVNAGFEFIGATESDKNLSDQTAEVDFSNVNLRAVKEDDDSGACVDLLDDGPHAIDFSFDCTDPATCKTDLLYGSTAIKESETKSLSLTFEDGIASLSNLNYADAGRLTLYAEGEVEGATNTSGNAQVDVVPAYLTLTADPEALIYVDSDDTYTYAAAADFALIVSAFGNEGNALANYEPSDIQIEMTRVAPAVTASGSVGGDFTYTFSETNIDGESSYTANYDEVGRITLTVQDSDYMPDSHSSASVINGNASITLGNFIPSYFEIEQNTPELVDTCSTFSYVGQYVPLNQDITYTVTAKNALGETTLNYGGNSTEESDDDWWALTLSDSHLFYTDNSGNEGEFWGQITASNTDNYDGVGTFTVSSPSGADFTDYSTPLITFPKTATALSEFAANFDVTLSNKTVGVIETIADDNDVCFKASFDGECLALAANNIEGATMRYGRLALESTYGPETEDLHVPIKTEYYDPDGWLLNTDDSCTNIDFSVAGGQIVIANEDGDIKDLVGVVASTGTLLMGIPVGDQIQLNAPNTQGVLKLSLSPDASGVEWPTHLNFNWNTEGDGATVIDSDDFPSATVTFGQFRGNDKVIQWREVFY